MKSVWLASEHMPVSGRSLSRRGILAGGLALPVLGRAAARGGVLRGVVTYRERMALPPGAVVTVSLQDVSLADAPSVTLAQAVVPVRHQVPVDYVLRYDPRRIEAHRTYVLSARITVGERLWFITTEQHRVFDGSPADTTLVVQRVAEAPPAWAGAWRLVSLGDVAAAAGVATRIEIAADGAVTGSGGCNRLLGRARFEGNGVTFAPMAGTQMACAPAAMRQEEEFVARLPQVRFWRIERDRLVLCDAKSLPVLVLQSDTK